MNKKWFYAHEDGTLGPNTLEELQEMAWQGVIAPEDTMWDAEDGPESAVPAATLLEFLIVDESPEPWDIMEGTDEPVPAPEAEPDLRPALAAEEPSEPAEPMSLPELFRKATFDLEQWTDEEDSIDLILAGDLEAMKEDPVLQRILGPMKMWGPSIMNKLWKHFSFTVENRRKYYLALLARRRDGPAEE